MPNLDRTGPRGEGPRTGRIRGLCRRVTGTDSGAPDNGGRGMGWGRGRGWGSGRGRGWGRGGGRG